jgi:hypothetical protein
MKKPYQQEALLPPGPAIQAFQVSRISKKSASHPGSLTRIELQTVKWI